MASWHPRRTAAAALVAVLVALPAGARAQESPAQETAAPADPAVEQALRERVTAYWNARVARSEKVFDFYAPPELGGPKGRGEVAELGNITHSNFAIEDVQIEGDHALVQIRANAQIHLDRPIELKPQHRRPLLYEVWDRVGGTWYRRPVPRGLSKFYTGRPIQIEGQTETDGASKSEEKKSGD